MYKKRKYFNNTPPFDILQRRDVGINMVVKINLQVKKMTEGEFISFKLPSWVRGHLTYLSLNCYIIYTTVLIGNMFNLTRKRQRFADHNKMYGIKAYTNHLK